MFRILTLPGMFLACVSPLLADEPVTVHVECEVPELQGWADGTRDVLVEWHPRIVNLLPTKGFDPPRELTLKIVRSNEGVGSTSGRTITVSSHWIEKHPDDVGLAVHELVHVIQSYRRPEPWWVTEGVADYIRWAIYEGKPQSWFPRPDDEQGYKKGYQIAGGFLLWLETEKAPGIVNRLNTAMRQRKYSEAIFHDATEQSLDELWNEYRNAK